MGGSLTGGFDEEKQARMNEIIQEVLGTFTKEFPIQFNIALVEHIKEEAQGEDDDGLQLLEAEDASYILKSGYMMKRGDVVKNWKRRWFVAKNKVDNFVIEYYETEDSPKPKGVVQPCGYRVDDFDPEEIDEFGPENSANGIKLEPYDDTRRQWYFNCDTEEDKKEWEKIFQNAVRKSDPPTDPDPVIAAAFDEAYRATRYAYGYYGWYSINCTEPEMLGNLIGDVLNRELLSDIYNDIPSGPTRSQAISTIRKIVNSAVVTAVSAGWQAVMGAVDASKSAYEASVKEALSPVFEAEENLKTQIIESVGAIVNPVMEDVGSRLCQPVFSASVAHVSSAFTWAIKGFHEAMSARVARIAEDTNSLREECDRAQREVDWWYSGPLGKSNDILWRMYHSDLSAIADCFMGGYTAYNVYYDTQDQLRRLLHNAIYTFEHITAEGTDPNAAFAQAMTRLGNDAKVYEMECLSSVMLGLVNSTVDEQVIGPSKETVQPINDLVPDVVKPFMNIENMTQQVIKRIVRNAMEAIVTGGLGAEQEKIDNTVGELMG
jgi:hypothetical protein